MTQFTEDEIRQIAAEEIAKRKRPAAPERAPAHTFGPYRWQNS